MTQFQWLLSVRSIAAILFRAVLHVGLSASLISGAHGEQMAAEASIIYTPDSSSKAETLEAEAIGAMANLNWAVAEDLLLQAQHLLHRKYGLFTDRQTLILDQLATTHVKQSDYRQANRIKEFNHFLGQRSTSIDTQIQAELALARWYLYSGQFDAARRLLGASLKKELSSEPFVPERALLRLDIELFSTQCCHSSDAIALLARAKKQDLSADLLIQFEQKVGDLLTLDGQASLAAMHYAQQNTMTNRAPQLISGLQRYNDLEHNKRVDMKLRQELRRRRILAGAYPDDALWSESPQIFTVALNEDFLPVTEAPQSEFGGFTDNFEPVIGTPFRFNLDQLKQALPTRYRALTRLEALEIQMTVDITAEGKAINIRFEDRYPRQVRDLMKKVFKVARFKPAIHDGLPVETLNLPFTQTFKTRENQIEKEV